MRGISRQVLARDAASKIVDGACVGLGQWWDRLQDEHAETSSQERALALVERARRRACNGCPALLACARWAEDEHHTGIAAGGPYKDGERQALWWAPRKRAGRPARAAS